VRRRKPNLALISFLLAAMMLLVCAAPASAVSFEFVAKWGTKGSSDGQFNSPRGVATDTQDNVYVADTDNNRIQVFDSSGNFLRTWGDGGTGDGEFDAPRDITADSQDNVYVIDSGNNRIQVFDSSGNFLRKWGSGGSGDGQFNSPRGVATDSQDNVYVVDQINLRIQVFDSSGNFLRKWSELGLGLPSDVAISSPDTVFVSLFSANAIVASDSFGEDPTLIGGVGLLDRPRGIAADSTEDAKPLYVVDSGNGRVLVFGFDDTASIYTFGIPGTGDGELDDPDGIAVDSEHRIYVADTGNHRIQVFEQQQLSPTELIESVESLGLPGGIENSLVKKLEGAQKNLEDGDRGGACGKLASFISEVEAHRGKKIDEDDADALVADANAIRDSEGCA
jgi:DNA-binding beta-propeller fold protein YncE